MPMAVITPDVVNRSEWSDFRTAFHEACINAGAQIGAVQVCGTAEEGVPSAGDEKGGWQAVQVRVDGGEHGIFRIGRAHVIRVVHATVDAGSFRPTRVPS